MSVRETLGPILVGGSGRCGTTIIARSLGLHPNVFTFPDETRFLVDDRGGLLEWLHSPESHTLEAAFRQRTGTGYEFREAAKELAESPLLVDPRPLVRRLRDGGFFRRTLVDGREHGFIRSMSPEHFQSEVRRFLETFPAVEADARYEQVRTFVQRLFAPTLVAHRAARWCDGTPNNVHYIRELHRTFPDLRFIHVIRDGREVARSFKKLGWTPSAHIALRHWFSRVSLGRRYGASLAPGSYMEVEFSRLTTDPQQILRSVLEFVGEEWTDELEGHAITRERALQHVETPDPELATHFAALASDWAREFGWPL